ncbi:MAG TPA: DUF6174 domain-containing protein [Gemmatimonadaceae bacterium]|nr:DUF6174 domain-containing protein [Gemmatimonadaceae bacterium]
MHRWKAGRLAHVLASVWLIGCSAVPTQPEHSDIDRARRDWLAADIRSYSFELSTASSWFPASGYVRVRVSNRQVVSATKVDGSPFTGYALTIDEIWARILEARQKGQVNSVSFTSQGVPVETDLGPWPVDGGVHYSVRAFAPAQ